MSAKRWVYLSGGVGGAKLLDGLCEAIDPRRIDVIVNNGDDFDHWGLRICPDLDTVMYTLAGLADMQRGWGLADETFHSLGMMKRYGQVGWFQLGDKDLATHMARTSMLRAGMTLTAATQQLCEGLGIGARVMPMSDEPTETLVDTLDGRTLTFQEWLVRERGEPRVQRVRATRTATASHNVLSVLEQACGVIIGPSNPYVSVDPILNLPGVRERVARLPVVAVSPIVGGAAVKGPLAHMIPTLAGMAPSAFAIAQHYGLLLRGLVVEHGDEGGVTQPRVLATRTVMRTREDRIRLAQEVIRFAQELAQ